MIGVLWRQLKVWRQLTLGPVAVLYRLERAVRVTRGLRLAHSHRANVSRSVHSQSAVSLEASKVDTHPERTSRPHAVIVGVGPGFGFALARTLATAGFDLLLVCRNAQHLTPLLHELHQQGACAESFGADATSEPQVRRLFNHLRAADIVPSLVVYSLQYFSPGTTLEVEACSFETAWRHNCYGAFLIGKAAAQCMTPVGRGTLLFVGSTSSILGRAEHLNLAVGKFGQRALAQVMARELWPKGIHVAHVLIDADIAEQDSSEGRMVQSDPVHIAQSILALHLQPRTAWSSELDLRPWNESFWEHC